MLASFRWHLGVLILFARGFLTFSITYISVFSFSEKSVLRRERGMADTFSKPSNQQQKLKWARIWFDKLVAFHGVTLGDAEHWDFSADQVIAYLRCKRDSKTPAWKRLKKILEGIMNYRAMIQNASIDFLIPIRNKMKEIILIERSRESDG